MSCSENQDKPSSRTRRPSRNSSRTPPTPTTAGGAARVPASCAVQHFVRSFLRNGRETLVLC